MKKIFLLVLLVFCPLSFVFADTKNSVNIYFFHSNTCSHCKAENKFLQSIEKQYDNVNVYRYEVHDEKNTDKIKMLEDIYQISLESVPVTVIGDTIFYGFSDDVSKNEFLRAISYYSFFLCTNFLFFKKEKICFLSCRYWISFIFNGYFNNKILFFLYHRYF